MGRGAGRIQPPMLASASMRRRTSMSRPLATAAGSHATTSAMAFSHTMSVSSQAKRDMEDSQTCENTSRPVSAVMAGGSPRVSVASRTAYSAMPLIARMGTFTPLAGSVTMSPLESSLPVPAVVGTATRPGEGSMRRLPVA